jgi:serine/threonine protein kinase
MCYLSGGTLKDEIEAGPLSIKRIVEIIERIARALEIAHNCGVIHRDIKPSNILFDEDRRAFLSDFGLAKQLDASKPITQTDIVIGTFNYMSPEQLRGDKIDHRSDIFGLGMVFYEMLTGKHPYVSGEEVGKRQTIWEYISHGDIPQLTKDKLNERGLPPECNLILEKSLAKDPNKRYENVSDMAKDIALLKNSASDADYKQTPVDASITRRITFLLARKLDDKIHGGVSNKEQFGRLYAFLRTLLGVIIFVIGTIAAGFIWLGCTTFFRLDPTPTPIPSYTNTLVVVTDTPPLNPTPIIVLDPTETRTTVPSPTMTGRATASLMPSMTPSYSPTPSKSPIPATETKREEPNILPTSTSSPPPQPTLTPVPPEESTPTITPVPPE